MFTLILCFQTWDGLELRYNGLVGVNRVKNRYKGVKPKLENYDKFKSYNISIKFDVKVKAGPLNLFNFDSTYLATLFVGMYTCFTTRR